MISINPKSDAKIERFFLCGGKLDEAAANLPSVREALLRNLPTRERFSDARIILAERATEALPGSNFTNLLDMEEYISAMVDGVILIVESAGSICELGAFVKTPEIRDKLIVLISSEHDNISSFIKLGALKYFSEACDGEPEISPFHWNIADSALIIQDYVIKDIISELSESLSRIRPRGKFNSQSLGDRIYLTLTICHILRGAKLSEIKDCYRCMVLDEFEPELIKHLSILEICGHLVPVSHGKKIKYFVPLIENMPMKFAFTVDAADRDRDTLRWIRDISSLVAKHEPTRMRIFQEHQHAA